MTFTRRALTVDDPLAATEACHVARSTAGSTAGRLQDVPLDQIRPNQRQPKRRCDEESLLALIENIAREDTISQVLGVGVQARPYRDGYRLLLDQAAMDRLVQLLGATLPAHGRAT